MCCFPMKFLVNLFVIVKLLLQIKISNISGNSGRVSTNNKRII